MTLDNWLSLIISLALSGVGIYMAHKSDISLSKIEEQNRHFDETMTRFVDRLVRAQTELLSVAILGKARETSTETESEDIMEDIERLRREVITQEKNKHSHIPGR